MPPVITPHNQYLGVNAHLHSLLQTDGGWDSFHALHIGDLAKTLNMQLAPLGYEADIEQSLQIKRGNRLIAQPESDITIYDTQPSRKRPASQMHISTTQELVLPIPTLLEIDETEVENYRAVAVYGLTPARERSGEPIVWVELLSPTNKPTGRHFEPYRSRRDTLLQSGLVFIEIDYLHHTPPTFSGIPNYATKAGYAREETSHPYHITIVDPRPEFLEGVGRTRQFDVDDPIPNMVIPLSGGDQLNYDFGLPYRKTFEEMLYGNKVDYGQLPKRFDLYSPHDQQRIANCMLVAIIQADKTQPAPAEPLKYLELDKALAKLQELTH